MSIGTAALTSANKGAHSLVSWAADQAGTGVDQLPRLVSKWLKGGRKQTEEQRWAEQRCAEQMIRERRKRRESEIRPGPQEPMMFGDERGAFVLETAEMSSMGEIVEPLAPLQGDGFKETVTTGGSIDARREELRRDESESEGDEEEDDGLLRVFEFDD